MAEEAGNTRNGWLRRIVEGVAVVAILGVTAGGLTLWRDSGLHASDIGSHHVWLEGHDGRLNSIESAGTVIHLAQATERLEKLEDGAEQTQANAVEIGAIQATQTAQSAQLRRIERAQSDQTTLILRALRRPPAPEPVSP